VTIDKKISNGKKGDLNMRKRSKKVFYFMFCFLFSFFILLYGVTVYRENSYDSLVQSFQLSEEMRQQGIDQAKKFQREYLKAFTAEPPLDEIFNDPIMIEFVAETHANALKYEYTIRFDIVPKICKRELSFPLRFFTIYGKLYSLENLQHVSAMGIVLAHSAGPDFTGDTVFDEMGEAILAWESEGNIGEGEWLNRFLASPEYDIFVQELYTQIEYSEGKSLENMVKEIHEVPTESHNLLSTMKTPFLKDAQELATVVYTSYQEDKNQSNISRVTFEAKILQELYERVLLIESLTPYQYRNLHWWRSFLPDPFVDLGGILVSSVAISIVTTYLMNKRYWK
jgi:hypothetical protein